MHATKEDIKPGNILFYAGYKRVDELIVLSEPVNEAGTVHKISAFNKNTLKVEDYYLGDCGMPGFNYDARPPKLHMDRTSAQNHLNAWELFWYNPNRNYKP